MELSKYQNNIIDFFKSHPHDNILVEALAGTGKSFLICLLTEGTKTSDIYVAFNNSIAKEFQEKIKNPKTKVSTLHSLGFSIMNTNLNESGNGGSRSGGIGVSRSSGSAKAQLDNFKIHKIVDDMISKSYGRYVDFEKRIFIKDSYVSLYNLCRLRCVNMNETWQVHQVIHNYNLFTDYSGNDFVSPDVSTIVTWLKEIDRKSKAEFESNHTIDFTDMLYITHEKLKTGEWKVPYWNLYTNIYVDECMPGNVYVETDEGSKKLSTLYAMYEKGKALPLAKSFNHETNNFEYKSILNVKKHQNRDVYLIKTEGLNKISATENHRFYTQRGYVAVEDLKVGEDCLFLDNYNGFSVITSIEFKNNEDVYDIEVEDNHNFICKSSGNAQTTGILSHNCQDLSPLQFNLIKYIKRKGGRYALVGDFRQSIYFFSGADAKSFKTIEKLFSPLTKFELPINYRCPSSHLEKVNKEFNIPIQPRPNAPKGTIKTIEKKDIKKYIKPGDMVISRKNKWFSDVVITLATSGIPIYIEDKEMVESLLKTIKDSKTTTLGGLKIKLEKIISDASKSLEKIAQTQSNSNEDETQKVQDFSLTNSRIDNINFTLDILKSYQKEFPNASVTNFSNYVSKILNIIPNKDCVRICSVHKAKGLEAENVFVLNEAKVCTDFRNSIEQQEQEKNLSYISITRAKDTLYLVKEPDA